MEEGGEITVVEDPPQKATFSQWMFQSKKLYKTYRKHPEAYWPTVGFLGVQMAWAVQISYVTSVLLTLGMNNETVGYAWLAGPLSGIFMQTMVGVISDYSESSFGRRRPYIIIGTISSVIGLIGFSNSQAIGYLFGDTEGNHPAGIAFAVIFFFFMDFAINYAMGPMEALMADTCSIEVYPYGQAWFAAHNGMGKTIGYGLGAISFVSIPIFAWLGTNVRALYLITAIFVAGSATLMVIFTPEKPHKRPEGVQPPSFLRIWKEIWEGMWEMPPAFARAFIVQCCAYLTWDCTFIYLTSWMAEEVYGGSPDSSDTDGYEAYEIGIEAGCLGLMGMALISVLWSLVLPMLGKIMGVKLTWALHLLLFALNNFLFTTVKQGEHSYALFLIALLGFPLAASYQIPWAIVTVVTQETPEKVALLTTIFNMSQCFPEILVSLTAGHWINLFGGKLSTIFYLGAIASVIGASLCTIVIQPPKLYDTRGTIQSASQSPEDSSSSVRSAQQQRSSEQVKAHTDTLLDNAF
mmetsp:Transcript_34149/g.45149  ORF Transcript_34149/g.45149 Transcript_34149/m.45149 type:complete len:521 (+) Transcript_34149:72-1634(+)